MSFFYVVQGKYFKLKLFLYKKNVIRIINQITHPDEGKILFNNEPLNIKHIRDIGYLPEERGLYPKMNIGDQAVYLAQLKGLDRETAKSELRKWFDKFEIDDWWNKKVTELSKGMAQKVQFIVTVLHKPKLLIFDEDNLDFILILIFSQSLAIPKGS